MVDIYSLRQAWVSCGVFFNIIGAGMVLAYTSSLLKGLNDPGSHFDVDSETASWLISSITVSWPPGLFLSSYFMEKIGRRLAHAIFILPGLMGWLIIYYASSVSMLMVGRILGGISLGATVSLGAVSIGEYTGPKARGMLLNIKCTSACIGVTLLHILGHHFHWRTVAALSLIPLILGLMITLTWPESPSWLASCNRFQESQKAFTYMRGEGKEANDEFEAMVRAQKNRKQVANSNFRDKLGKLAEDVCEPGFFKPLGIIIVSFILEEACGRHLFAAYGPDIIHKLNSNNDNNLDNYDETAEFVYVIIIDLITIVSTSVSSVLFLIFKRRTLLFYSTISSCTLLLLVCLYLFIVSFGIVVKVTWIPLSLLFIYYVLINFGPSTLPFVLLGEIFPLPFRGLGTAIGSIILPLSLMGALKVTPVLLASIDLYGTFFVFSLAMILSLIYLYFTLPETKDRTLQEIGDYFDYGKFINDRKENEAVEIMLK